MEKYRCTVQNAPVTLANAKPGGVRGVDNASRVWLRVRPSLSRRCFSAIKVTPQLCAQETNLWAVATVRKRCKRRERRRMLRSSAPQNLVRSKGAASSSTSHPKRTILEPHRNPQLFFFFFLGCSMTTDDADTQGFPFPSTDHETHPQLHGGFQTLSRIQ